MLYQPCLYESLDFLDLTWVSDTACDLSWFATLRGDLWLLVRLWPINGDLSTV